MSAREFLRELAKLNGRFRVGTTGQIRCEDGTCPIVAVANLKVPRPRRRRWVSHEVVGAAEALKLHDATTVKIIGGSDWPHNVGGASTRRQLLKVLGLKEPRS